jgi:type I restriction enzyme S subunit
MELKAGYKQTDAGVIPEDWDAEKLEEYTSFISYGFTNPMPTAEHGIYLITAADISNGRIQFDTARHTTEVAYRTLLTPKSKPKKDDILLTKDGSLGRLALVDDEIICINQSVAVLRPNDKVDPIFLKLLLESPTFQKKMLEDAGGSTIKHIYITIVNLMAIAVPKSRSEQRAIAAALSDADALITALDRLIAKKRDIKQAAMQELLTGKRRLSGFGMGKGYKQTEVGMVPVDWDLGSLGEKTTKVGSGITPTGGERVYKTEGRPFIRSQNIGWGVLLMEDIAFIDDETHDSFKATEIETNDVLLNITGASIGRSAVANNEVAGGNVNQHVCIIRPESKQLDRRFLNYFLLSYLGQRQIDSFQAGGNRQGLNFGQIRSFRLPIPHIMEQCAIAAVLSDMDAEMSSLEARREKTLALKQGMMQELLTGRIRLVQGAEA